MERIKRFLSSFWTIIFSLALGVVIGIYAPGIATACESFGEIYFKLIELCCTIMLPVIIISSIGKIIISKGSSGYVYKILIALFLTFAVISGISILSSIIVSPITAPTSETTKSLGKLIINSQEKHQDEPIDVLKSYYFIREIDTDKEIQKKDSGILKIIAGFFPNNIFESLANKKTVEVLIFSIIFGLLFKYIPPLTCNSLINLCDSLFEAFNTFLTILLYLLPFGIISLISHETTGLDFNIVISLFKLGERIALVFLILFIICILIIKYTSKKSFVAVFKALKEPMILSFVAENLVAMPSLISAMTEKLGFNRNKVGSAAPLWMGMEIHADVALFAAASIFTLQLYGIPIGATELSMIFIGSIAAGLSALGAAAILWVALIRIILDPLDIPSSPIILALMLFEPFFNGLLYLLNSVISCAAVSILAREPESKEKLLPERKEIATP